MESVAARLTSYPPLLRRIDFAAVRIWLLAGGLVTYLAFDGGGYDIVVHSQVAIVVWWVVLGAAACGMLPAARVSRSAWGALGLFGGFVVWTALVSTSSLSSERSLQVLALDAGYLGALVLGIAVHRDREQAVRHTIGAVSAAIALVALVALASRLRPGLFANAAQTASYLPGSQARLSWPLNYWNALAALLAFGLPLLLSLTSAARSIVAQAAAAAAIPIVALCGYLTFSRGGLLAFVAAVIVYFAFAPDRLPKLVTAVVAGAASAGLIAGCVDRPAIERGVINATARHEGATLILPIILACVGVALVQVGIGLATRHGRRPSALTISRPQARTALALAVVVLVLVAIAAGAPTRLSHAWHDFKRPTSVALSQDTLQRFGTLSGNGRYAYWKAALDSTSGHVLTGNGPGTYQFLWLKRAPFFSYVENAHSLYFETLAETGVIGLVLLVGFVALAIVTAVRLVLRTDHDVRARAAGIAAALVAFAVSAGSDWIWQVPVLPTAFILVAAAVFVSSRRPDRGTDGAGVRPSGRRSLVVRAAMIVLAIASLVSISLPLATTNAERRSQTAAAGGDLPLALTDAQSAAAIEPGAGSPQVQIALVLEAQGKPRQALVAAQRAVSDEPDNWSSWLVVSRLEAETGHASKSLSAYLRARSLNPRSPVFRVIRKRVRA